ncbi:hypothetical protein ACNQR9_34670 [Mycolicibacterium peregrinum]
MGGSKTRWNRSRPGRVQLVVDEYAEDLTGPQLPPEVEEYLAGEREWHRLLRGTGAVSAEEVAEALMPWAGQ